MVGLKKVEPTGVQDLLIRCDSQLIAHQLIGEYASQNKRLEVYNRVARRLFK